MFSGLDFLAPFRRGDTRRSAVRTLRSLSAAQLADLGIPPDTIESVVDGMLRQNEQRETGGPRRGGDRGIPAFGLRAPA